MRQRPTQCHITTTVFGFDLIEPGQRPRVNGRGVAVQVLAALRHRMPWHQSVGSCEIDRKSTLVGRAGSEFQIMREFLNFFEQRVDLRRRVAAGISKPQQGKRSERARRVARLPRARVGDNDVIYAQIAGFAEYLMGFNPDRRYPLFMAVQAITVGHRAELKKTNRNARKFGRRAPRHRRRFHHQNQAIGVGKAHRPVVAGIPQTLPQRMRLQ